MNIPPFPIEPKTFPPCDATGADVDVKSCIEPKTGLAVALGTILLVIFGLVALVTIYLFVLLLIGIAVDYFRRKKALAHLKGSAIEVNEYQFPEIHSCAQAIAQRLGLPETPAIYLVEGNTINAAATRLAGRQVVVLMDDTVDACLRSGDTRTLTFILAHELAHHALGHTGYFHSQIARMFKWLSRLDEFSCDAVANQIVGDPTASAKALIVLLSGPQMLPYINLDQLIEQAREVDRDKNSKKAEKTLTHPLTLRRILRFVN